MITCCTHQNDMRDDTLYHYCSVSAFASIIKNNLIWLSSLSLSNDYMEGKLTRDAFDRLLKQSDINACNDIANVQRIIHTTEKMFDGLGFCLSQKPDLLSQWRGYADDGQGFSIGFSKSYIKTLSEKRSQKNPHFKLFDAIYEPSEHEEALKPAFNSIKTFIDSGGLKEPQPFMPNDEKMRTVKFLSQNWEFFINIAFEILPKIYCLKSKAFEEEHECRLISNLMRNFEFSNQNLELATATYRVARNRLIPFREVHLVKLGTMKPIKEVHIGPKNITPVHEVERFLYQCGHKDVEVKLSSATYR